MQILSSEVFSAIVQLIVFIAIPFFCWLFTKKNLQRKSFTHYVGLKAVEINMGKFIICSVSILFIMIVSSFILDPLVYDKITNPPSFYGLRWEGIIPALFYAFIRTGLAEEILFRGFIGHRLINKIGFAAGNLIQAIIFGLLHGMLLYSNIGLVLAIAVTIVTGLAGWLFGFLTEKIAHGSIIPSWLVHGICNLTTAILSMFAIII